MVNGTVLKIIIILQYYSFTTNNSAVIYNRIISRETLKLNKVFSIPFGQLSILHSYFNSLKQGYK